MADDRNKIWIKGGKGTESITGFIDGPTTLGANSTWGDGMVGAGAINGILEGVNDGRNLSSNSAVKSIYSTIQTWQSSSFNAMAFNIIVVANKEGENPLTVANKVWDYVLPSKFDGILGGIGNLVQTPGGYTTSGMAAIGQGGQQGAVSLSIGKWFKSTNSWLVSSATIEVSKQRVKGTDIPLFVKIDMVLNPARMFHAAEVKKWITVAK